MQLVERLGSMRSYPRKTTFAVFGLIFWSLAILIVNSCSEDYTRNAVRPQYEVVNWKIPNSYELAYRVPVQVRITGDGKTLICNYYTKSQGVSASAICIVDLMTAKSKWFTVPYTVRAWPLSAKTLGVFPARYSDDKVYASYFLDLNSLSRGGPDIPAGFPVVSEESSVIAIIKLEQQEDDIWFFDRTSRREYILSASRHGLSDLSIWVSPSRLLVAGRKKSEGPFGTVHTQLWSFPSLKMICDHEAEEHFPWNDEYRAMPLGRDSFCFPVAPGLRKVANIDTGKVRFSIGHSVAEKDWMKLDDNVISVIDDTGYVRDSGRIICLNRPNAKETHIETYDANIGGRLDAVTILTKNLDEIKVTRWGGEWVVVCAWIDPKTEFSWDARKMWLVLYRLKDLAKAKKPIEIMFDQHIEIINGRMVVVMNDNARIFDLSSVVNF